MASDPPRSVRKEVKARDADVCRCCGVWEENLHLHHLIYRSHARNHTVENLVTLCWRCHKIAHAHPTTMRAALREVIARPGLTALAWLRQQGADISELVRSCL